MDYSRQDLKKYVFKDLKRNLRSQISNQEKSKENNFNWRKPKNYDKSYTKLRFRTADMNDPDVLKGFLRLNGIPYRPYEEYAEELALFLERKRNIDGDPKQILIDKLSEKLKNLEK